MHRGAGRFWIVIAAATLVAAVAGAVIWDPSPLRATLVRARVPVQVVGPISEVGAGFGDRGNTAVTALHPAGSKLYATTWNIGTGTELWVTSDGRAWRQLGPDGFGDPRNVDVHTIVEFGGALYLGTDNSGTGEDGVDRPGPGAELFRSDDGEKWVRVVGPKLAGANAPGFGSRGNNEIHSLVVYDGVLYASTCNYDTGGEIWRSADGAVWEKAVGSGLGGQRAGGFGRPSNIDSMLTVFDGRLYSVTWNDRQGFEVWRTSDGVAWQRCAEHGLGSAENRMGLVAAEHRGRLYVGTWSRSRAEIWWTSDGIEWSRAFRSPTPGETTVLDLYVHDGRLHAGLLHRGGAGRAVSTSDGVEWTEMQPFPGKNADDGVSAFAAFGDALYIATDNASGTAVWRLPQAAGPDADDAPATSAGEATGTASAPETPAEPPVRGALVALAMAAGLVVFGSGAWLLARRWHKPG